MAVKANLHEEVARSSGARFFVCFIAFRSTVPSRARAQNYPTQQNRITPGTSSV